MLFFRLLRYTTVSCGLILLLGEVFVGQRLLRSYLFHGAISGMMWPLLSAAVPAVLEVALVLGTPLGVAIAMLRLCPSASGKSAGGSVLGCSRLRAAIGFGVLWFVIAAGLGSQLGRRLAMPGVVARGLLRGARDDCSRSLGQQRSPVLPLLNARWICTGLAPPRLVGKVTIAGAFANFSAANIEVPDDLAGVELDELEIESTAVGARPKIHLAVRGASLRGAVPWAKTRRLSAVIRAIFVAGLAAALGIAWAIALEKRRAARRNRRLSWVEGISTAAIGGGGAWALLWCVDAHESWSVAAYLCIPPAAILSMVVASLWAAKRVAAPLTAYGELVLRWVSVLVRRKPS